MHKKIPMALAGCICAIAIGLGATEPSGDAATLALEIGPIHDHGDLVVELYDNERDWLNKPLRTRRERVVPNASTVITFADVPEGDLSAFIYVDVNRNGHVDKDACGVPTEPLAYSDDAQGGNGQPPAFAQARIPVYGQARTIVRMHDFIRTGLWPTFC